MMSIYENVQSALRTIRHLDTDIRAWVYLDEEKALAEAKLVDQNYSDKELYGVVIAAKDIFDTADMPTRYGSPIYHNHRPVRDAAIIAQLREHGALILGKTFSTEFASSLASPTRNPHNLDYSPGGSSSGSAAAVASGMVAVALGSQTLGSIIRPASYCGVIGFKPSYGRISRSGVLSLSETLDTMGLIGSSIDGVEQVYRCLARDRTSSTISAQSQPRIAFCKGPGWNESSEAAREAIKRYIQSLRASGIAISDLDLREGLAGISEAGRTIHDIEVYRNFAWERTRRFGDLSANFREILKRGAAITPIDYQRAIRLGEELRLGMSSIFKDFDMLITLSATDEAPKGDKSTGSPAMNIAWTFLRGPCISLPKLKGPRGLPIGVQLIGAPFEDSRLLASARWLEANAP